MFLESPRSRSQDAPLLPSSTFASATSSSSAFPRQAFSARQGSLPQPRSSSPPASSYFTPFSGDHHYDPQPNIADASAHFAYSTSLRRHHSEGIPAVGPTGLPTIGELRSVAETEGPSGLWRRTVGTIRSWISPGTQQYAAVPLSSKEGPNETASARFAHYTVQDTLAYFGTSPSTGLPSASIPGLLATHGYNEFAVSAPESLLIKFAKTIYENPLILLLFGSACVSVLMGNIDDAVSIAIAIIIVLTGMYFPLHVGMYHSEDLGTSHHHIRHRAHELRAVS